METKKEKKLISENVKNIIETFEAQKWIRYQEEYYIRFEYYKRIIFTFPDKVKIHYLLNAEEYKLWRIKLETLTKSINTKTGELKK